MTPLAAILLPLLAAGGWATDAQTDQRTMSRLRDAARAGRTEEVLAGVRGLPVPLLDAVAHGAACGVHPELLRALVDQGARLEAFGDDALVCLLQGRPAAARRRPDGGARPDDQALAEVIRLLASGGATRHLRNGYALGVAGAGGDIGAVKALLAGGALPGSADAAGNTPLHATARSCWVSTCAEVVQLLITAGALPDRPNGAGQTPYQLAIASGTAPFVGHLLSTWPWKPLGASGATASADEVLVEPRLPADYYAPGRVLDGDAGTCWCAGGPPPPAAPYPWSADLYGEAPKKTIRIRLERPARIRALRLWPGCTTKPGIYGANNRVAELEIRAEEETTYRTLPDDMRFHDLGFTTKAPIRFIQLRVHSVFPGTKYPDTCIGEIQAVLE